MKIFWSAVDIAKEIGMSSRQVIRYCNALGYHKRPKKGSPGYRISLTKSEVEEVKEAISRYGRKAKKANKL